MRNSYQNGDLGECHLSNLVTPINLLWLISLVSFTIGSAKCQCAASSTYQRVCLDQEIARQGGGKAGAREDAAPPPSVLHWNRVRCKNTLVDEWRARRGGAVWTLAKGTHLPVLPSALDCLGLRFLTGFCQRPFDILIADWTHLWPKSLIQRRLSWFVILDFSIESDSSGSDLGVPSVVFESCVLGGIDMDFFSPLN